MKFIKTIGWMALAVVGVTILFYFNRHHHISKAIESFGSTGRIAAVLIMAIMCLTPIPTEGLLLVYFNVYGVVKGAFYAWAGYMISAFILYIVSRYLFTRFIQERISPKRFETVNLWIEDKQILGLFVVRILPIPAFIVNCILGTLPSVTFWNYTLSAAVAIMPYYITSSCLYLGVTTSNYTGLFIGIPLLLIMGWISMMVKKRDRAKDNG